MTPSWFLSSDVLANMRCGKGQKGSNAQPAIVDNGTGLSAQLDCGFRQKRPQGAVAIQGSAAQRQTDAKVSRLRGELPIQDKRRAATGRAG